MRTVYTLDARSGVMANYHSAGRIIGLYERNARSMVDGLSVVLPCFNEEENVETAVTRALGVLGDIAEQYEVIVVNDGSRDATKQVAQALVEEHYPRVRLINHVVNQGYGMALSTGFSSAQYGLVFFTDSDNQFDIAELKHFLPLMDHYDIVTGFRVYRFDPVLRCIISWCYNRVVNVMFRLDVRDVDCAFKLFRKEVFDHITIECSNFFVSTEIMAKARKWNFRIAQKGVRHYPRTAGETTVRPGDVPRTLREVFRMWKRIYLPNKRQLLAMSGRARHNEYAVEFLPAAS